MSSIYGRIIQMTVFGESHNEKMGVTLTNLPPGIKIDFDLIDSELTRRRPAHSHNTSRVESDDYEIISGYFNGFTTGMPLTFLIRNHNINSKDYDSLKDVMRPSHADYPAFIKYRGYNDYRGGGHFSGRLTAPIVIAGAIAKQILNKKGIKFSSIVDVDYQLLEDVAKKSDSIGGQVKTVITDVLAGIGEPMFDSVESRIASGIFSIPGAKAVSFGLGEDFKNKLGSDVVDELEIIDKRVCGTNNNGGVNGGITNGLDIVVNTTFKPSASIAKEIKTIDVKKMKNTTLKVSGRHDSFYVDRAVVVVEAIIAFTLLDLIIESEGKQWIK